ncbi:MAG: hypothetical protein AAGK04_08680, partial [Planctomycetota bacterium]
AGPLNPPPGPIAPTPFDTGSSDPRTTISVENTPGGLPAVFLIDQPGSYVLESDVDVPIGKAGLRVEARNVVIDLNGFTIRGNQQGLHGIELAEPSDGLGVGPVYIFNGAITGVLGEGVSGADGRLHLERLDVSDTGGDGIVAGPRSLIDACAVENAGDDGIVAGTHALVTRSSVFNHDQVGFDLLPDSAAYQCVAVSGRVGFRVGAGGRAERCVSTNYIVNGIEAGDRAAVTECQVSIGFTGVRAIGTGARIEGNLVSSSGIALAADAGGNLIVRNTVHGNGSPFDLAPGNTVGPTVDAGTITLIANPTANIVY